MLSPSAIEPSSSGSACENPKRIGMAIRHDEQQDDRRDAAGELDVDERDAPDPCGATTGASRRTTSESTTPSRNAQPSTDRVTCRPCNKLAVLPLQRIKPSTKAIPSTRAVVVAGRAASPWRAPAHDQLRSSTVRVLARSMSSSANSPYSRMISLVVPSSRKRLRTSLKASRNSSSSKACPPHG